LATIEDFNGVLCSSIDQAISDAFSIKVLDSLYLYLHDKHALSRDEVPYRLEAFLAVLEKLFGAAGSQTIGTLVARILYAHLNLRFEKKPSFTLLDYVSEAKQLIEADISATLTRKEL
jgi:hypothetical protein